MGEFFVDGKNITLEELKVQFPPIMEGDEFRYSGKWDYCHVEVSFSDPTQVKITIKNVKEIQKFSVYHKGCHDRYLRRTID